ncbi:MAG: hypothetical protein GXP15_12765 [Gammaproteobacteria bacterium]|nr:hypothetical protein [Gammaproteobacteria bacterium]
MTETRDRSALYTWLADAVEADATIITSSRRLARELRAEHDRQQLAAGRLAWSTPRIQSCQDWLSTLLQLSAGNNLPRLIDPYPSKIFWERSVARYLGDALTPPHNILRQARAAWQRIVEWRVPVSELARQARSRDELAFAKAARSYKDALLERHWIDAEQVAATVIAALPTGELPLPQHIVYAGFDRTTPVIEALFAALRDVGCKVAAATRGVPAAALSCSSYANAEAEMRAAGAWARVKLAQNPAARVAIVATDLETESARFARLIREGLAPGWQSGGQPYDRSVNVSYGRRLSAYPAIHVALLCLRWTQRGLVSRDVSILLRSPFLGTGGTDGRSKLELRLRSLPDRKWTAAALADALAEYADSTDALGWLDGVRGIASLQTLAGENDTPANWAARLDEILTNLGWPGEAVLNSSDFQLLNRWRNLLNEFAALDVLVAEMTFSDTVHYVESLARDIVYQPDTGPGLVSLLGSLEAAGMEFDHLWVAGTDASRWPASGQPMALVSRNLQRAHAMPDASPEDSLEYSRRVLTRLVASAPAVHLSWACTEQDSAQLPSPLLEELSAQPSADHNDPCWYAATLLDRAGAHTISDDPVPAVDGVERVAGGAYTVHRQTVEPFAAFAFGRLGLQELRRFEEGLSASLRGSLLHETLYQLMRQKPSRIDIAAWSEQDIARRIDAAITAGFSESLRHADAILRRLFALERVRLHAVISQFLAMEKTRPEFSIEHVEERIEFEFAGVQLSLRADRIDRLSDGALLIIDYKTGLVKHLLGRDGNPVDLQVVVYAAALEEEVGALALFNIGSRAILYKGVGGSVAWNDIVQSDWHDMLRNWKQLVYSAMEQIGAGDVRLNLRLSTEQSRLLNVLSRAEEHKRAV